jgi:outer membrane biogenesis lipoprotein LolB
MQGAMDTDAARNQILDTMGGRFSGGSGSRNPFAGLANPYLQKTIDDATGDISRSYKNGTAANTDAAFSRAGAFGGSAWQEQVANNERELATSLGRTANDMRMQDYGMQANLAESQVGRDENAYQQERGRSMSSLSMLPNLMNNDLRGAQALLGTGDAQQGFDQDALDLSYQDFQQRRDYPLQQLDIMGNALGKVSGVAGGTSTATQTGGPSRNRTSGALGGALAGFQMGGPWGAVLGGLGGLLK